jgi:hypothetical protein
MSFRSVVVSAFLTMCVILTTFSVLHPYYKLNYIKMVWGGEEEQIAEINASNPDAKNWQREAERIVEATVGLIPFLDAFLTET